MYISICIFIYGYVCIKRKPSTLTGKKKLNDNPQEKKRTQVRVQPQETSKL